MYKRQFQDIKDALRRDVAIERLTRGSEPLISIASDLGFSTVAAFHRAFRRWTGGTPGDYREGGEAMERGSAREARTAKIALAYREGAHA